MRSETTLTKIRLAESHTAMIQWRKKAQQLENEIAQLKQQLTLARQVNHVAA